MQVGLTQRHQAFLQDENFFGQVLESLEDYAVFTTDLTGHVSSWNRGAEKLLGYTEEEIIGQDIAIFFTPEDLAANAPAKELAKARRYGRARDERFHVKKVGTAFWASGLVFPLKDQKGRLQGFTKIMRDLSESRRVQKQLANSERRFKTLIERGYEAIVISDRQGNYTYASPAIERTLGYTPEEFMHVKGSEIVCPEDIPELTESFKDMHKPGSVVTGSGRFRHKLGHYVWIEATVTNLLDDPEVGAMVSNFHDITAHVEARKLLEESEERFRFMAESLPQKIFTATADGKVDYFNQQWVDYTGVPMDDLHKRGVRHLVHPDDISASMETWRNALKTGGSFQNEQRLKRADGAYRLHISYVRAMRDSTGKIVRFFGSMTDIEDVMRATAERKKLEQLNAGLKEQRAQLIALNKSKDDFISLASHQLRTPATGVKQFLGMVMDGFAGEVSEKQCAMLEHAYESNERQITIINDLLRVAQVDAGKVALSKEPVDLVRLVRDALDEQASKFKNRKQQISFKHRVKSLPVPADTERLRMVLDNLIDNASKYTYDGKGIEVTISRSNGRAAISISDEGVGILPEDLSKLFRKFTRLNNPLSAYVGGSGLGLYWAKKIIDLHGGTIKVASKPGEGTTFTIYLPLARLTKT